MEGDRVQIRQSTSTADFFIHDKVKSGEIEVRYCDTERMLADGFTKPLQGKKFVYFRNETLNMNVEF